VNVDYLPPSWDPPVDESALAEVAHRCAQDGLPVQRQFPLAAATTLGVGGPAAVYVELADLPAVQAFSRSLRGTTAAQVPLFILGKGSNTLLSDDGFAGVVVHLGRGHKWLRREGRLVSAGAGEAMPAVAAWVAREGLAGLEFAAGIPATVGGSVRMNAGAHGGETGGLLRAVELVLPEHGESCRLERAEAEFGYRRSSLPERALVIAAAWELRPDDPAAIRIRLDELRAWRRGTQPLRERNCGSVFTNPPGDSAGRLIEAAGAKGLVIGSAQVSMKHANFITVRPGAKAADVHALIGAVRERVHRGGGPLLEPEVRLVGHFR
jgi:UDP-N-acetylmuramate dehydrogenase